MAVQARARDGAFKDLKIFARLRRALKICAPREPLAAGGGSIFSIFAILCACDEYGMGVKMDTFFFIAPLCRSP